MWLRRAGLALSALLLSAGIGLLAYVFWPEVLWVTGQVDTTSPWRTVTDPGSSTRPLPDGDWISIPSVGIGQSIYEGATDATLSRGVWHVPPSLAPGQGGNIVLAGHRIRKDFALLNRVQVGDTISVYWDDVEHVYAVTKKFTVTPVDRWITNATDAERLTLYTCIPRYEGDKRTVVYAEPIAVAGQAQAADTP